MECSTNRGRHGNAAGRAPGMSSRRAGAAGGPERLPLPGRAGVCPARGPSRRALEEALVSRFPSAPGRATVIQAPTGVARQGRARRVTPVVLTAQANVGIQASVSSGKSVVVC